VADIKTHVNTVTHFVAEILMSELFCIAHQIELPFVEKLLPYDRFTSIFFPNRAAGNYVMSTPSRSTPSRGFRDGVDEAVTC